MIDYEKYAGIRDSKGFTDGKVAQLCGFGRSTFTDWKNHRSVPKIDKVQKIADLFNVSVDYLMTGKEKEGGETYYLNDETKEIKSLPNWLSQ